MAKRKKVSAKAKQERQTAKAEKFQELAVKRVNAAIGRIRLLRNLGNRNTYSYNEDQVNRILNSLRAEVDAVEKAFSATSKSVETGFSFDEDDE